MIWKVDPKYGDVKVIGECSYSMYRLWKGLHGHSESDIRRDCMSDYYLTISETTRFAICMRYKTGTLTNKQRDLWPFMCIVPMITLKDGVEVDE